MISSLSTIITSILFYLKSNDSKDDKFIIIYCKYYFIIFIIIFEFQFSFNKFINIYF